MKEIRILLASSDPAGLAAFSESLESTDGVIMTRVNSGKEAISAIKGVAPESRPHLVVFDDNLPDGPGLKLVEALLEVDAMILTALVSDMPRNEFHEKTEGLGILTGVPSNSGPKEAQDLLDRLRTVLGL